MGTRHYGVCLDCQEYVSLDRFSGDAFDMERSNPITEEDEREALEDDREDYDRLYALLLTSFVCHHRGHRQGVYSDGEGADSWESLDYLKAYTRVGGRFSRWTSQR